MAMINNCYLYLLVDKFPHRQQLLIVVIFAMNLIDVQAHVHELWLRVGLHQHDFNLIWLVSKYITVDGTLSFSL